jgi:hypothetical protein
MPGTERFTQRSRRVLSRAREEAVQTRNSKIDTGHLLLGLINEEGSVAGRTLRDLGVASEKLRSLIKRLTQPDREFNPNKVEVSDDLQFALENSVDEARRLGHHYIGTEHLLLGLIKSENKAIDVLKSVGVTEEQIRRQVRRVLNESVAAPPGIQPEISILPYSGSVGTNFLVRGNNFRAGEDVVIWIVTPSKNETRLNKEYTADDKGRFQFHLFSELGFEHLEIGKWQIYGKGIQSGKTSVTEFELSSLMRFSRPLRVFLCHASADKSEVRKLYYQLKSTQSIDPWLDEEKLLPGQKWQSEIPKAVRNSDIILVCISRNSIDKVGYIQKEIRIALDIADEQPEDAIFIIPARLEECFVPERLQQWHWVNLYDSNGIEKLFYSFRERAKYLGLVLD